MPKHTESEIFSLARSIAKLTVKAGITRRGGIVSLYSTVAISQRATSLVERNSAFRRKAIALLDWAKEQRDA